MPLHDLHARFNEAITSRGLDASYRIAPAERAGLEEELSITTSELLRLVMERGRQFARPPISNFLVGAAGLGCSGTVFLGVNLEFGGAALGATVHAEQFLVVNAMSAGERRLIEIATSAAPCGHCRQFLNELPDGSHLVCHIGSTVRTTLGALLPHAFGPADLFADVGEHEPLLSGRRHLLRLRPGDYRHRGSGGACRGRSNGSDSSSDNGDAGGGGNASDAEDLAMPATGLTRAALAACARAYAPYTNHLAGVAVRVGAHGQPGGGCAGAARFYSGWSVENAAYNPTLPPLQVALINMVVDGADFNDIEEVVLVQGGPHPLATASVCFAGATKALLAAVAPGASLTLRLADKLPGASPVLRSRPAEAASALLKTPARPSVPPQPPPTPPLFDLRAHPPLPPLALGDTASAASMNGHKSEFTGGILRPRKRARVGVAIAALAHGLNPSESQED